MGAIPDFVESWDRICQRLPLSLPGGGRDAKTLIHSNVDQNRSLGPMTDWHELWTREQGKRCLMICAGPSLTESLPEIAVAAEDDDTFTMGFNRSHRLVDVDYFVAVDRVAQPDWITRDTGETILIAATTAAPHVCREFKTRYWGDIFLEGADEGLTPLHVGLPITLSHAMHAAYRLGAREIELYGCDYALQGHAAVDGKGTPYYHLDKYYADQRSHVGTDARRSAFGESWPVIGLGGRIVFINYELWANAAYTVVMCRMLEYAGVPVVNKSKAGILFWGLS
jgi:hypothetical protein